MALDILIFYTHTYMLLHQTLLLLFFLDTFTSSSLTLFTRTLPLFTFATADSFSTFVPEALIFNFEIVCVRVGGSSAVVVNVTREAV